MILMCECGHSGGAHSTTAGCIHLMDRHRGVICPCDNLDIVTDYRRTQRHNWKAHVREQNLSRAPYV